MSNLSRRMLVASAAALPALAVPVVAIADQAVPDPIFAAIETHRTFDDGFYRACEQLDEAEATILEHRPIGLVVWRNYMIAGTELESMRDRLLAEPGADQKGIEREYKEAKAQERAQLEAGQDWDEWNGLASLRAELDRNIEGRNTALEDLTKTRPTTTAGVGALLEYMLTVMENFGDHEWWVQSSIANAAHALRHSATA